MKKVIRFILSILLSVVLPVLFAVCGMELSEYLPFASSVAYVCTALTLLLAVANLIASAVLTKKINSHTVQQAQSVMLEGKAAAEENLLQAQHRMDRVVLAIRLYMIFLCAILAPALALFGGATKNGEGLPILFSAYIYFDFIYVLLREKEKPEVNGILTPDRYPALYEILHRAQEKLGSRRPVILCSTPQFNASAFEAKSTYFIDLGSGLLPLLNEEELESLLIHELAHLEYRDVTRTARSAEMMDFLGAAGNCIFLSTALLRFPTVLLAWRGLVDTVTSSAVREQRADETVLHCGNAQAYTALLAKLGCYDLFSMEQGRWIPHPFYQSEEPEEQVIRTINHAFRTAVSECLPLWRKLLEQELPALIDTHPTFRERRAILGNPPYEVTFPDEKDPSTLREEIGRIVDEADRLIADSNRNSYQEDREEQYLKPLKIVEDWEAAGKELREPEHMVPVITAYLNLNRRDKAEELCDRMLRELPDTPALAYARYTKGQLLLARWDPAGISLIDRAIEENDNDAVDGLNTVILFCRRMNLPEELEAYRKRVVDQMQKDSDVKEQYNSLSAGDRLSPEQLPDGRQEEILNFILQTAEGSVSDVWLVRKTVTDRDFCSAFIIRFREDTQEEQIDNVMNAIFRHLDNAPYDWQYSLFLYSPAYERFLRKIPCRIWSAGEAKE